MATITWDSDAWLLRAKAPSGETVYTWTYPLFEDWIAAPPLTPAEYVVMTTFIENHISKKDREDILEMNYNPGPLVSRAVDAWYDLSVEKRLDWRNQTIYQLESIRDEAEQQESAAMDWILSEDQMCAECIEKDMYNFVRGLVRKYKEKRQLMERMIMEEESASGDMD